MKAKTYYHGDIGFMRPLSLIVAVDEHGGFGKDGKIPWHFSEDLKRFKQITKGAACIMGRKTYADMREMVVARKKDDKEIKEILPGRDNYVVSKSIIGAEGATVVPNIRKAVELTERREVFVIGGEKMYIEALPWVNKIYMTVVKGDYQCDKFFPIKALNRDFKLTHGKKESDTLSFLEYDRIR